MNNKYLVTLLSALIIILSFVSGFFVWQNQRLVKAIQQALSASSSQTIPTTTPNLSPTTDPHSSWKSYTDQQYGISVKAPFDMNVKIVDRIITVQDYPFGAPPPDSYYKAVITTTDGGVENSETLKGDDKITQEIISTITWKDAQN